MTNTTNTYQTEWLNFLAEDGVPNPDQVGRNHAVWSNADTQVLITVRFSTRGTASIDVAWVDPDGVRNGMFAPRDCDYMPWMARDIKRCLEGDITHEVLNGLCKPDGYKVPLY